MQLRASPQLKVGTAAWSRAGERHLTVIAKLTYELRSGTSELRATAEDLLLGEVPDDDLEGWMRVADLVPFKQRPKSSSSADVPTAAWACASARSTNAVRPPPS